MLETVGHRLLSHLVRRTSWLVVLFVLLPFSASALESPDTVAEAQPEPRKLNAVRKTVRGFDRLNSDFIEPQHYVFTAMLQFTHTYDIYTLRSAGRNQSMTFAPDMNLKVGPYFGWKWFFAGYTFEIGNVNLHRIKQELDLSIYSSQIGIDLFYRRTGNDYKLRDAWLGKEVDTTPLEGEPFGGLKAGITGVNVYYIFNHGRFSYPAAFSQSTIQKVSCGSWMAGVGYTKNSLSLDYNSLQRLVDERMGNQTVPLDSGLMFSGVRYHNFNVSGGYAYNWVFKKGWLFAASLQAALAYKKSSGDVAENKREGFNFENVNLDGIGRFGLVYNNMRWYAGASVIVHMNNYHKSRFSTNNIFGSMNMYVGYNFGLKKKYRRTEN